MQSKVARDTVCQTQARTQARQGETELRSSRTAPVRCSAVRAWVGLDMRRNLRYFTPVFSVAFESFGIFRVTDLSALTLLPRQLWPVWGARCPGAIPRGARFGRPGYDDEAKFAPLPAGILGRVPVFWHFSCHLTSPPSPYSRGYRGAFGPRGARFGRPGHETKFAPLHAGILGRVREF